MTTPRHSQILNRRSINIKRRILAEMAYKPEPTTSNSISLPSKYFQGDLDDSLTFDSPQKDGMEVDAIEQSKMFCTQSNIPDCMRYLDNEVTVLGFPSLTREKGGEMDITGVLNCLYDLLQHHHRYLLQREEMDSGLHRATSDVALLKDKNTLLKKEVEGSQREIALILERERQLKKKLKSLSVQLKDEQEEIKRLKLNVQHRESQFLHETRKREREVARLKERMEQLVSDKSQEKRLGMELLNSLNRGDGKRAQWRLPVGKQDEELYRVIIGNYEEKQKELMAENSSLRDSLATMQKELVSLLNEKSFDAERSPEKGRKSSPLVGRGSPRKGQRSEKMALSSGHFQMPYELVREGIEQTLRAQWRKIKEELEFLRSDST